MERVAVRAPSRSYEVVVGTGLDGDLRALTGRYPAVAVVRDAAVAGPDLDAPELALPGGEGVKTVHRTGEVLAFLEASGLRRDGCVVAVGGGTIGDLAGFAAAVWQRGVDVIQVPTTLLAMVDASVGGKTGVNTDRAKNAVGAFWQPAAVISDLDRLKTLPMPELRAGFAEVVKYAVAMDADLAGILQMEAAGLAALASPALESTVARCVRLKAAVVEEDERELSGRRAILNYGHTAAHALEAATGYSILHGVAVAHGMRVAARVARDCELCEPGVVERQDELLAAFGLPGSAPQVDPDRVLDLIPGDKKSAGGVVRWVLPREWGRAEPGHAVPADVVRRALEEVL